MIKTILIPTDFRVESLNTLKYALHDNDIFEVDVILLHTEFLSDSITDLLFYSAEAIIKTHTTPVFEEALSIIRNRYKELQSVRFEVLHSHNDSVLSRFLRTQKVDEIFIPKTYSLRLGKRAFDPVPMLKASGFPVYEIGWDKGLAKPEKDQLDELFRS